LVFAAGHFITLLRDCFGKGYIVLKNARATISRINKAIPRKG